MDLAQGKGLTDLELSTLQQDLQRLNYSHEDIQIVSADNYSLIQQLMQDIK